MSLNIPESNLPRLVIIGGGFAGLSIIKNIDRKEFQVILLDKNNYHTFQPLLYQVATSGLEVGSIAYPLRKYIKHFNEVIFRMTEVVEINPEKKELITPIGNLHYDYLVIATGSENNFFGNKLLEEKALVLKNIPQALDIRSLLLQNFELASQTTDENERQALLNIVIAGGGPTGVEMAGSLAELKKHVLAKDYPELDFSKMNVFLVEGSDGLLKVMSKESSEKSKLFLENMGVKIMLNAKLENYDGETATFSSGEKINTKALIWAAGVKGTIPSGIPPENIIRGNRLKTNSFNQIENFENMFAVGDAAACVSEKLPGGHPMVASVAIQQGKAIAKNLLLLKNKNTLVPFVYNNKGSMATIGRNKAVVDLHFIKFQGIFAWFVWTFVHLLAIVGFRNKFMVFYDWMWNYFSYDKALRFIIRPYSREKN